MKKVISFSKDIKFNTKIYEITSISLENTLTLEDNNEINGEFIVSGEYKMNDSSINTEPFIYGLPFDISLDDNYETNTIKIEIDDFNYEIINEQILKVDIDVAIDGKININEEIVEEIEEKETDEISPDVIIDVRNKEEENIINEYNGLNEKDLFKEENTEVKVISNIEAKKVTSIFENFDSKDENYVSYYVHIVRENDNIESICAKYNVSKDDIKEYNNIDQITLGNKIIIPYINNETI